MIEDPTHCDVCKNPLTGRWGQLINDKGEVIESRCGDCDSSIRRTTFLKDKRITTSLMLEAICRCSRYSPKSDRLPGDEDITASVDRIQAAVKTFEQLVWFGGWQKFAQDATTKGTSVRTEGMKLLCFTICDRAMITLDDGTSTLSLLTEEDSTEARMGIQGIQATEQEALNLIQRAEVVWASGARPEEDREVRIAGT